MLVVDDKLPNLYPVSCGFFNFLLLACRWHRENEFVAAETQTDSLTRVYVFCERAVQTYGEPEKHFQDFAGSPLQQPAAIEQIEVM